MVGGVIDLEAENAPEQPSRAAVRNRSGSCGAAASGSMAGQCGSCLVGLATLLTKADASMTPTSADKEKDDGSIFMKVMLTMLVVWTTLVVMMTLKLTQRAPPQMVMTTGTQTIDEWVPISKIADMTVNSIRHELSRRRLPADGTKPELVARLSHAMSQVV